MGIQLNLNPKMEKESNVVDFDDLWFKNQEEVSAAPGVYVRQDQQNEIDVLWSGVKEHNISKNSPLIYLGVGFLAGIIATFVSITILSWGLSDKGISVKEFSPTTNQQTSQKTQSNVTVPQDGPTTATAPAATNETYKDIVNYTIQPGDSLGKIANKFYHSSSPENVALIQKANELKSVHSITAGKNLIIPVKQ